MRLTLYFLVLLAFLGPFAAVLAIERSKWAEALVAKQEEVAQAERDAAQARYQYYLDENDQKNNLKQAMEDAKTQYEELLKEQPNLIKAKQTTVEQTVIKPVVTQQVVTQQVPATSSTPKSSTKTKSS